MLAPRVVGVFFFVFTARMAKLTLYVEDCGKILKGNHKKERLALAKHFKGEHNILLRGYSTSDCQVSNRNCCKVGERYVATDYAKVVCLPCEYIAGNKNPQDQQKNTHI